MNQPHAVIVQNKVNKLMTFDGTCIKSSCCDYAPVKVNNRYYCMSNDDVVYVFASDGSSYYCRYKEQNVLLKLPPRHDWHQQYESYSVISYKNLILLFGGMP